MDVSGDPSAEHRQVKRLYAKPTSKVWPIPFRASRGFIRLVAINLNAASEAPLLFPKEYPGYTFSTYSSSLIWEIERSTKRSRVQSSTTLILLLAPTSLLR